MTEAPMRRSLNHSRSINYESYERSDGLFEIEGHLRDCKGYDYTDRERGLLQPGSPIHDITAKIVIDDAYFVRDFSYRMEAVPFSYCHGAVNPKLLEGACISTGWRKALDKAFGPERGCAHLRELVFGMGTVAFQTISALADEARFAAGLTDKDVREKPFFIGGCHSWAESSPVVDEWFPQFHRKAGKA